MRQRGAVSELSAYNYSDIVLNISKYLQIFPEDFNLLKAAISTTHVNKVGKDCKVWLDRDWDGNYNHFYSFFYNIDHVLTDQNDFDNLNWASFIVELIFLGKTYEMKQFKEGTDLDFYPKYKQDLIYHLCLGNFKTIRNMISSNGVPYVVWRHRMGILAMAGLSLEEAFTLLLEKPWKNYLECARTDYFDLVAEKGLISKGERDALELR